MPDREALFAVEREVDAAVGDLSLLRLPIRTVFTLLYGVIDGLFHGNRLRGRGSPRLEAGYAAAARMSYLAPHVLRCPLEPRGVSAADAISVFRPHEHAAQLSLLLSYGHFCEIMPAVRHRHYTVARDTVNARSFLLRHPNQEFRSHEERDIVLSELAMPYFLAYPLSDADRRAFDRRAAMRPALDLAFLATSVKTFYEHYVTHGHEHLILNDAGFLAALGVDSGSFVRLRAAFIALSDYCLFMAEALFRMAANAPEDDKERLFDEGQEWITAHLEKTFTLGLISAVARIPAAQLESACLPFMMSAATGAATHAGDGYYPPIFDFGDALLFTPNILRLMVASRNIPYVVNKTQRETFDNLVSHSLEPKLLDDAAAILGRLRDVQIARNVVWSRGEIDLLVYGRSENVALHIQAKAAIPADSTRMVRAVEGRTREGLEQLRRLRSCEQEARDEIFTRALGRDVRGARVVDVLLCRASIGTDSVWRGIGDAVPANLPLLNGVVMRLERFAGDPRLPYLSRFPDVARDILDEMCRELVESWDEEDLALGEYTIRLPLLRLNQKKLTTYRRKLHQPLTASGTL